MKASQKVAIYLILLLLHYKIFVLASFKSLSNESPHKLTIHCFGCYFDNIEN